jgi:hypothetical protein
VVRRLPFYRAAVTPHLRRQSGDRPTFCEQIVLHACQLLLLLSAIVWTATEFQSARQPEKVAAAGPEWRRTTEGWIKVGSLGASGLKASDPQPVQDPTLHPAAVAAFSLLAGVLSLAWFERPLNRIVQ